MFLFGRESDPDLKSKRLGDLLGEKAADRVPVRAADELSAEPAIGQGVVAQLGPRILAGTLCLEQLDRAGARECFLQGERLVDAGKPGRGGNESTDGGHGRDRGRTPGLPPEQMPGRSGRSGTPARPGYAQTRLSGFPLSGPGCLWIREVWTQIGGGRCRRSYSVEQILRGSRESS